MQWQAGRGAHAAGPGFPVHSHAPPEAAWPLRAVSGCSHRAKERRYGERPCFLFGLLRLLVFHEQLVWLEWAFVVDLSPGGPLHAVGTCRPMTHPRTHPSLARGGTKFVVKQHGIQQLALLATHQRNCTLGCLAAHVALGCPRATPASTRPLPFSCTQGPLFPANFHPAQHTHAFQQHPYATNAPYAPFLHPPLQPNRPAPQTTAATSSHIPDLSPAPFSASCSSYPPCLFPPFSHTPTHPPTHPPPHPGPRWLPPGAAG